MITPEIYEEMNKEFIKEGTPLRLTPTTQESIDKWLTWKCPNMHERTIEPEDMVAELWRQHDQSN